MSGPESEPSLPPPADVSPSADSRPWSDTDLGLHASPTTRPVDNPGPKPVVATEQLSTIGHIGRYALKYQIGEGGLGRVYAAHDPLLSRLIAIKTLNNLEISAEERDAFNTLFLNEARAAGGLSHPHIVTVFDAGVSDQGPYIAMELLRGRDLRQLRLEGWRPTPTQAALMIRRVADALAYAHSKGVVHRDVKPANIFMVGRTQPRVLDFGIARVAHHHDPAGDLVGGSPYYMSPEQIRAEAVDRRTDVFSLGVVLYELLTDQRPFRGSSLAEITQSVLEHQPPTAHEIDPNIPKALSDIAARAMEKNRDDRFSSARSLSRELRHWLDEHPQHVDAIEDPEPKRRQRAFAAIAGGVTLAVAGLAWFAFGSQHDSHDTLQAQAAPAASAIAAPPEPAPAASVTAEAPVDIAASASGPVVAAAPPVTEPPPAAGPTPEQVAVADLPTVKLSPVADTKAPPPPKEAAKPKEPPKETPKERRAREARERAERAANAPVAAATGTLRIAVSPWGNVEVDGRSVGTAPPLNELTLPEGRHTIIIRNDEFPPFQATVNVVAGQPVNVKHRFGS